MKTEYFTKENIEEKSLKMLKKIESLIPVRNISFIPEISALVVIDMQKYFLDKKSHAFMPSAISIIPHIKEMLEEFYRRGLPVIFTQHTNTSENAGSMEIWWRSLIMEGDPMGEIINEFDISKGIVIKKTQYDAFYNTSLEDLLKNMNVKQLVISGVMTNLCCETTARSAFIRRFDVFFPVDGTATYNENFHFSSLLNLSFGFSVPVLVKDILEKLKKQ